MLYTEDDVAVLDKMLDWQYYEDGSQSLRAIINAKGNIFFAYRATLLKDINNPEDNVVNVLSCPFVDVPLYINDYPELVAWRLSICR